MRAAVMIVSCVVSMVTAGPVPYYFKTKLDHYSAGGEDSRTFNMMYLVDTQYYANASPDKPRPIFFYAGNEGSIMTFYKNSGFMTTTLAKEFGALVVFGEHRYFGNSFPFPKADAFKEGYNSYLTVENTMMDYVDLIKYIKVKYNAQDKAVITFGGSYGGMLAAWLRMKFPHVFQGALAASAPLVYFKDSKTAPEDEFSMIATRDFNTTEVGSKCADGIKYALKQLNTSDSSSYELINSIFNPCTSITK
jgi:pimeloyl-ACP methyl ester carboxylesterase